MSVDSQLKEFFVFFLFGEGQAREILTFEMKCFFKIFPRGHLGEIGYGDVPLVKVPFSVSENL